jgi:predicted  nucleic acid-binding Zn-ribbon protein
MALAVLAAAPAILAWLTAGLGAVLVGLGWPRRAGAAPHCARCGYQYDQPRDRLAPTCPECGNPWRWFGRMRPGRPVRHAPLLVAGGLALCLALAGAVNAPILERLTLRSLPVRTLIAHAVADGPTSPAWDYLTSLTLSASQRDDLAGALLDRRLSRGGLDAQREAWLDSYLFATPRQDLQSRAVAEALALSLEAPESVRVGASAVLALRPMPRDRDGAVPGGRLYVVPAGIQAVTAGVMPDLPPPTWRSGPPPGREARAHLVSPADPARVGPVLAAFEAPGVVRLHARAWVGVFPFTPTVTWGPDGTPSFDVSPAWLAPVELTREITVTGAPSQGP